MLYELLCHPPSSRARINAGASLGSMRSQNAEPFNLNNSSTHFTWTGYLAVVRSSILICVVVEVHPWRGLSGATSTVFRGKRGMFVSDDS